MTFEEFIKAESDLLNAINDISRLLRAVDKGEVEGFSIDVNAAKSQGGTIIRGLTAKFDKYKVEANALA